MPWKNPGEKKNATHSWPKLYSAWLEVGHVCQLTILDSRVLFFQTCPKNWRRVKTVNDSQQVSCSPTMYLWPHLYPEIGCMCPWTMLARGRGPEIMEWIDIEAFAQLTYCWWLKSGVHQLRLLVFPIIFRVSYIPGGAGFQPSTVFHPGLCCMFMWIARLKRFFVRCRSPGCSGDHPEVFFVLWKMIQAKVGSAVHLFFGWLVGLSHFFGFHSAVDGWQFQKKWPLANRCWVQKETSQKGKCWAALKKQWKIS